jgi:hypothetical protein
VRNRQSKVNATYRPRLTKTMKITLAVEMCENASSANWGVLCAGGREWVKVEKGGREVIVWECEHIPDWRRPPCERANVAVSV